MRSIVLTGKPVRQLLTSGKCNHQSQNQNRERTPITHTQPDVAKAKQKQAEDGQKHELVVYPSNTASLDGRFIDRDRTLKLLSKLKLGEKRVGPVFRLGRGGYGITLFPTTEVTEFFRMVAEPDGKTRKRSEQR